MEKALAGDTACYESLLKELSVAMRSYLMKRVSNKDVIEDLVQEILMGIHKARATYDSKRSFSSWAFAIAHYKLTDFYRKNARNKEVYVEDLEKFSDEQVLESDILGELEEAIEELKPREKQALRLMKMEGRSIKETAQLMQTTEGAVKVTAHRAYKHLKVILEKKRS